MNITYRKFRFLSDNIYEIVGASLRADKPLEFFVFDSMIELCSAIRLVKSKDIKAFDVFSLEQLADLTQKVSLALRQHTGSNDLTLDTGYTLILNGLATMLDNFPEYKTALDKSKERVHNGSYQIYYDVNSKDKREYTTYNLESPDIKSTAISYKRLKSLRDEDWKNNSINYNPRGFNPKSHS